MRVEKACSFARYYTIRFRNLLKQLFIIFGILASIYSTSELLILYNRLKCLMVGRKKKIIYLFRYRSPSLSTGRSFPPRSCRSAFSCCHESSRNRSGIGARLKPEFTESGFSRISVSSAFVSIDRFSIRG